MSSDPVGRFDRAKLNTLAASFREEDQLAALTAAATAGGDLSRQPELTFKTFTVAGAKSAVSPDCSYRLLMGALNSAAHTIAAYVYNIGAAYILELLKAKRDAGVKVRVMVDPNDPNDRKSRELANLQKLGIEVKLSPSTADRRVFTVCHQKYVVVDGITTVVESANWAESSIPVVKRPGGYQPGNREWLIRVDDKSVAQWFLDLFEKDWNIPAAAELKVIAPTPSVTSELAIAAGFSPPEKLFGIETSDQPVTLLPIISPVNYLAEVKAALEKAKKRIWIQQQYIIAGDGVTDLLEVVHDRAAKCDVRIVTSPKFAKAWEQTIDTLRAAGLLRRLRAQNLQHVIHCHNKGVIVDDAYVVVSSTNWSENSILRAREAGFLVGSKELAGYYASVFAVDWKEGIAAERVSALHVSLAPSEMV